MFKQDIRPAGAGHETLAVLAGCLVILACAAAYVGLRPAQKAQAAVAATQIDARRDLTPAEQGIYADLRVAADEIAFARHADGALPGVAELADLGLPPFVADNSTAARGGHGWSATQQAGLGLYLGRTADAAVAGSFLMRVATEAPGDTHDHGQAERADAEPDVWLSRDAGAKVPDPADDAALAAAGWRQVLAQFDSGVTRQGRP